jgi:hypothetical protein
MYVLASLKIHKISYSLFKCIFYECYPVNVTNIILGFFYNENISIVAINFSFFPKLDKLTKYML